MSSIPRALRSLSSGVAAITIMGTVAGTVVGAGFVAASGAALAAQPAAVRASVPAVLPAALPSNVQRIAGASRFDTAIATSQDEFPVAGSAAAVVLTRADTYPDALAGVPLAAKVGGPLLLTPSNSLTAAVKAEITRVLPGGCDGLHPWRDGGGERRGRDRDHRPRLCCPPHRGGEPVCHGGRRRWRARKPDDSVRSHRPELP